MESFLKTNSLEKINTQKYEFRWGFMPMEFFTGMKGVAVEIARKGKERPINYGEDPSQLFHLTLSVCDFD